MSTQDLETIQRIHMSSYLRVQRRNKLRHLRRDLQQRLTTALALAKASENK